jgi:hypothetical protein
MGDRERGAILIAFSLALLVVSLVDSDGFGTTRSLVELGLVVLGLAAGAVLIVVGSRRR